MEKEQNNIKTIKGFNHNLQCRNKQYEVGKVYAEDGKSEMCFQRMHAISQNVSPLTVFEYYAPAMRCNPSRYCMVETKGEIDTIREKIVTNKLFIEAEIGIDGLAKAHESWVQKNITNEHNSIPGEPAVVGVGGVSSAGDNSESTADDYGVSSVGDNGISKVGVGGRSSAGNNSVSWAGLEGVSSVGYKSVSRVGNGGVSSAGNKSISIAGHEGISSAGDKGVAEAGDGGVVSVGYFGISRTGYHGVASAGGNSIAIASHSGVAASRGASAVGDNGVAVARGSHYSKVKGGKGSLLVLAIETDDGYNHVIDWKATIVDGETIKRDTWYTIENGKWVEVNEQ